MALVESINAGQWQIHSRGCFSIFDIQWKKNLTGSQYLIADSRHVFLLIRKLSNHNEFHYPVHFFRVFFVLPCHRHLMFSTERSLVFRYNNRVAH